MMGNLSVEKVTDSVSLAYKFDKDKLKIKTRNFFNKNYAKIFGTNKWEMFMKEEPKLANGLLVDMAEHLESKRYSISINLGTDLSVFESQRKKPTR